MVSDISAALVALISLSSTTASLTVCGRPRERWKTARSSRKQSGSLVKTNEIHGLLPFPKGSRVWRGGFLAFQWPSNPPQRMSFHDPKLMLSFMAGLFLFLDFKNPQKTHWLRYRVIHICCSMMQRWYQLPDDDLPRLKYAGQFCGRRFAMEKVSAGRHSDIFWAQVGSGLYHTIS